MFLCNISNLWPGSMQHSFIILLKLFVSFLKSFKFSWIFEYFCSRRPLARIAPSWVRDCSNLPNYFTWWFASDFREKYDLKKWLTTSLNWIFCFFHQIIILFSIVLMKDVPKTPVGTRAPFWSRKVFEEVHSHVMDRSISLRNLGSRVQIWFWSTFQYFEFPILVQILTFNRDWTKIESEIESEIAKKIVNW